MSVHAEFAGQIYVNVRFCLCVGSVSVPRFRKMLSLYDATVSCYVFVTYFDLEHPPKHF